MRDDPLADHFARGHIDSPSSLPEEFQKCFKSPSEAHKAIMSGQSMVARCMEPHRRAANRLEMAI
jgi:hypothetical protein